MAGTSGGRGAQHGPAEAALSPHHTWLYKTYPDLFFRKHNNVQPAVGLHSSLFSFSVPRKESSALTVHGKHTTIETQATIHPRASLLMEEVRMGISEVDLLV